MTDAPPRCAHQSLTFWSGSTRLTGELYVPQPVRACVVVASEKTERKETTELTDRLSEILIAGGLAVFRCPVPKTSHGKPRTPELRRAAQRLSAALSRILREGPCHHRPIGILASDSAAAVAFTAAAQRREVVGAIVTVGGRASESFDALTNVHAPTLCLVGGSAGPSRDLNAEVCEHIKAICQVSVVPLASHDFDSRTSLKIAGRIAVDWFTRHLDREGGRPQLPS